MSGPDKITRTIHPDHLKRAMKVEDVQVGPYLEQILYEMQRALDLWRHGKGSVGDLNLATDAFLALMAAAELRGLA